MVSRSCSPYSAPVSDASRADVAAQAGGQLALRLKDVAGQVLRRGKETRAENVVGG